MSGRGELVLRGLELVLVFVGDGGPMRDLVAGALAHRIGERVRLRYREGGGVGRGRHPEWGHRAEQL
eukprot:scaffold17267_cov123-Isochrysis_galbana.AAC.2